LFIELAEALDCPACGEGVGLVAFVRASERRRVLEGSLGCPLCEVEFPIASGAIDFRSAAAHESSTRVTRTSDDAEECSRDPALDPAMTLRLAALLGIGERAGSAVLLGRGLATCAPAIARLAERVEILAVLGPAEPPDRPPWELDELAAGIDPVRGLGPGRWPLRSGALDGIALRGAPGERLDEAWRCLRPAGRLVLVDAEGLDTGPLLARGFEPLAADARTWVGQRS